MNQKDKKGTKKDTGPVTLTGGRRSKGQEGLYRTGLSLVRDLLEIEQDKKKDTATGYPLSGPEPSAWGSGPGPASQRATTVPFMFERAPRW